MCTAKHDSYFIFTHNHINRTCPIIAHAQIYQLISLYKTVFILHMSRTSQDGMLRADFFVVSMLYS